MFYLAFGLLFPSEGRPHFVKFRELFRVFRKVTTENICVLSGRRNLFLVS